MVQKDVEREMAPREFQEIPASVRRREEVYINRSRMQGRIMMKLCLKL